MRQKAEKHWFSTLLVLLFCLSFCFSPMSSLLLYFLQFQLHWNINQAPLNSRLQQTHTALKFRQAQGSIRIFQKLYDRQFRVQSPSGVSLQIAVWVNGPGSLLIDPNWWIQVTSIYLGLVCEELGAAVLIPVGLCCGTGGQTQGPSWIECVGQ